MRKGKINNKVSISTEKKINNPKTQKTSNASNKNTQNKIIKKPISSNSRNNQDKIKETKYQTEVKPKNKNIINNNQKNNFKENKNENKNINLKKEENQGKNDIKDKTGDTIENKDATIVMNNENNKIDEIKEEEEKEKEKEKEKNKYLYLKLSKEEINKLININKTNIKPEKENILKNNLDFIEKNKLKYLTDKQRSLFNEIDKINIQKKYLIECSLNNLPQNNIFHKNDQNDNIKNLEKNENYIMKKIDLIDQEINNINNKDNNNNNNIKEKYKEQIKIDEINKKYKDIIMENNIIYKKIKKDAEISLEKRNIEMDLMEREEIKKKSLEIMEKIKYGKIIEKKRKKEIIMEVAKNKPFIHCNNIRGQKKNYLYFKMATSFDKKEERLLKKQKNIKIKLKDNNEQKEILRNDYLEKKKKEMKDNINNLHQMWKERSDLLPKYKSPLFEKVLYSEENMKENEKNKIENKKRLYFEKEKYSKEKIHLPPISNILRKEREQKSIDLHKKIITKRKNSNLSIDNPKNINRYINNNINNISNNSKEKKLIKSYSSASLKNNINLLNNQKGKLIFGISINNNNKNIKDKNKNPNDFNYLEDLRKERLLQNKNEIKNMKLVNNSKNSNLDFVKGQIQLMEEKYNRDKELLKVKGGYANNQELGDKISELLVNSIKNKLDILENMNK